MNQNDCTVKLASHWPWVTDYMVFATYVLKGLKLVTRHGTFPYLLISQYVVCLDLPIFLSICRL